MLDYNEDKEKFDTAYEGIPLKILVADDDRIVRVLLQSILEEAGFSVVLAENGRQAIEKLSDQIGVALLDILMPEMNGMECLRYIHENELDIQPIMITISGEISDAVDAMKYGAFDYLTKPLNPEKLIVLVKRAFQTYKQARRLRQVEAELEKAREHEIDIAVRIQKTLLLGRPPRDIHGLEIANLTIPSQRVDGDFYDFFKLRDYSLDLVIGDVMGKGIASALMSAAVKSHILRILNELIRTDGSNAFPSLEKVMTLVRSDMIEQMEAIETFVTLCYARFDIRDCLLRFVDCGHMRTIHYHKTTNSCDLLNGVNMPLGFPEQDPMRQVTIPFEPGDLFFFYSDGLTEAKNPEGEFFGESRLVDVVNNYGEKSPQQLIDYVREEIISFSRTETFQDDFTCVVVKICNKLPRTDYTAEASLGVLSDFKELERIRIFIRDFISRIPNTLPNEDRIEKIVLAVSEAIVNVIQHGYCGATDGRILINCHAIGKEIVIRIYDWGKEFDPRKVPAPKLDGSQDSGYGLYIISQCVDEVDYFQDTNGGNCVSLKVYLE